MLKVCCDICDRPMEVEYIDDCPTVKLYKTKEINTRKLYPHLCESCANKIDEAIQYNRKRYVSKKEIVARYAKINAERKQMLKTKG